MNAQNSMQTTDFSLTFFFFNGHILLYVCLCWHNTDSNMDITTSKQASHRFEATSFQGEQSL